MDIISEQFVLSNTFWYWVWGIGALLFVLFGFNVIHFDRSGIDRNPATWLPIVLVSLFSAFMLIKASTPTHRISSNVNGLTLQSGKYVTMNEEADGPESEHVSFGVTFGKKAVVGTNDEYSIGKDFMALQPQIKNLIEQNPEASFSSTMITYLARSKDGKVTSIEATVQTETDKTYVVVRSFGPHRQYDHPTIFVDEKGQVVH